MRTKKFITLILILLTAFATAVFAVSASAGSDDPADSYTVQTAPCEDDTIDLWFDYSYRKTFTSDTEPTGMDTFSIYMAKNEIESAQFVLYSDTDHAGMSASVSAFTDSKGNTVDAEIYYEMYVTTEDLAVLDVYMADESSSFIRAGETPDPIAPLDNVGTFKLNGGKSQAFLIRAKTLPETSSGWYSSTLNVKDSGGNIVKTAEIYLYVWDFALSEETALETSFYISDNSIYGGNYKVFYDYMLENRMCGMDLPNGPVSSRNAYLTNDRVVSIRIASAAHPSYLDRLNYPAYRNIYNDLASSANWDKIKDKLYIYCADEPLPKSIVGSYRDTVDSAIANNETAEAFWGEDVRSLVTLCVNHAYPYDYYMRPLDTYQQGELKDAVQAFIDYDNIDIFTPMTFEFTPYDKVIRQGDLNTPYHYPLRAASTYIYSGAYGLVGSGCYGYFDWEGFYGAESTDRYRSYINYSNQNKSEDEVEKELWTYCAGISYSYTYCNHMIENTGLQSRLLFWQCYQEDVTGYLYYACCNWSGNPDTTVTGAKKTCKWYTNPYTTETGHKAYGDGVLIYGRDMGYVRGVDYIGTLRTEIMRDGIEDYQMMYQLAKIKGNEYAKSFVNSVSNDVADYISMPAYDRSAWSSSMDEYDILETVRRSLGNALESAENEICEHRWDNGTVTKAPTCSKTGIMTYECEKCGAKEDKCIPSIHSTNETFVKVSGYAATCTTPGKELFRCSLCGFEKNVDTPSNHSNNEMLIAQSKNSGMHNYICKECNSIAYDEGHSVFYTKVSPTCTTEGYSANKCKFCAYATDETVLPVIDHEYINGTCTMCGKPERIVIPGDIDGNGKVNSLDLNVMSKILVGVLGTDENMLLATDLNCDGKISIVDFNLLTKYIVGVTE